MNKATDPTALLESALIDALGPECLLGEDAKTLFSTDVYGGEIAPALVVRPQTQEQTADAVRIAATAGWAITQRGGGMSYTGGYLPTQSNTVMLDLSGLNRIVSINEDDLVITVEAGVTWQQIWEALTPRGLRLPFFGTFSGSRATVGGGLSNGALFMGTARYGSAADIVVGMEVIDARGRRIQTGQAAFYNGRPGFRQYGPDLTGLFVHDAGALGVKTLASLRMMPMPEAADYASFAFATQQEATRALSAIGRSGFCEEAYIFDPATTQRSLDPATLMKDIGRLGNVIRSQSSMLKGLQEGAKMAMAGRRFVEGEVYTLHCVCAGRSVDGVRDDRRGMVKLALDHNGVEISNTIPKAARANPFEPLNGILGSQGERWAALNSKVPHSDAERLIAATEAAINPYRERMAACGVTMSFLYIAIAQHIFSYEPVLRWFDEWLPVHRHVPEPDFLNELEEPSPNQEGRALVDEVRSKIVDVFAEFGAASNQIGKTYPMLASLNPTSRSVLRALKKELDPEGLINPGALGDFSA
jgi:FAD/FMN-containing dehydrogenase